MSGKQDLTRQEEFKRATAGVLRAMAHADAEVQVAFQPGPSGVAGKRVRLPLPTRALPANEMAKLRGAADAAALKLRHHDEAFVARFDAAIESMIADGSLLRLRERYVPCPTDPSTLGCQTDAVEPSRSPP